MWRLKKNVSKIEKRALTHTYGEAAGDEKMPLKHQRCQHLSKVRKIVPVPPCSILLLCKTEFCTLELRRIQMICINIYKTLNHIGLFYMNNLIIPNQSNYNYNSNLFKHGRASVSEYHFSCCRVNPNAML